MSLKRLTDRKITYANSPLQRNHWQSLQLKGMLNQAIGIVRFVSQAIKLQNYPVNIPEELYKLQCKVDDYKRTEAAKLEHTRKQKKRENKR